MSKMIDDYFEIYTEKVKEFGENTVVLHQTGSFYEIYEINNANEIIGNAKKLSNILEMVYANKKGDTNNSSRTHPNFIGFNVSILDKYLSILLRNEYTVVIVDQLEASAEKKGKLVKRGVTKIYSPSLQPTDYTNGNDFSPNLVSLYFNINQPKAKSTKKNAAFIQTMDVSICCINNNNNLIEMIEETFTFLPNDNYTLNLALENLSRILYRCNPKELLIYGVNEIIVKNYFNEIYENVRFYENEKFDINYQNKYLREIWDNISFGLIEPIEYFNLNELSLINLVCILKFIENHDSSYVKNLNIPKISNESNNLVLELNTIFQLNIINYTTENKKNSLFDIIDYTRTSIGKRHLRNILCKPFKDPNVINNRYLITEELKNVQLDKILDNIIDIEKMHRKMGIAQLHQYEFVKLNQSYKYILELIQITNKSKLINFENCNLKRFNEFIDTYNKTFDLSKMNAFNLNSSKDQLENYFNKGIIKELDTIQDKINDLEDKRKELRLSFDKLINPDNKGEYIKLIYTEFEGYSFTCTKIRYQLLLDKLGKKKNVVGRIKQTNNSVKFVPEELEKLSKEIITNRELLSTKITINYKNTLLEYYREYNPIFDILKDLIEVVDVCNSNLKCSQKFKFVKPELHVRNESFIEVDQIRHPLIESLGKEYISNDIKLDNNSTNGILCYGINSSGKSTLLRAIGINVVMAQAGLFVAAKSFKFSPFDTIISQVDLSDNIFSGKSSFITEMLGLKRILQCSGKNTLVLSDELSKGTEHNSSTALVSSIILELIKSNTKFFFTSHLHELPKVQDIIDIKEKLKICHLSVDVKGINIIYERKLKDGPGSSLYGLEVSKSLLECPELIEKAYEIRNKLIGNDKKIKKSVYNSKKIIDKCQICNSTKQLEVDHVIGQCTTDDNGFLDDSRHKNHISNLCILCHDCHLQKTLGRIKINGYKDSINGKFLDWEKIEF